MRSELVEIVRCLVRIGKKARASHRWRLGLAILLMAGAGALTNVPPVALGKLLDQFVEGSKITFGIVWPFLAVILGCILLREVLQVARKYCVEDTCTRLEKETRTQAVEHLMQLDLLFFADELTGSLQGRLNRSIEGVIRLLKLSFLDFLPTTFTALFALGIALFRAPMLGVMMTLVIPVGIWIVLKQVRSQKGIRINLLEGKDELDGTVVEVLGGLEEVRAMDTWRHEVARVEETAERLRGLEITHHIWMAVYDAAKYLNEGLFHIAVLAMAIWMASTGQISVGDILTYSMLFMGVITPLREIHRILDEAHESSIRARNLYDLMDEPKDQAFSRREDFIQVSDVPRGISPAIKADNIQFSYPNAGTPAISNFDLTVRAGEFVGICGPTGCGKSTLLKLVLRLLHLDSGSISILGQDINQMSHGALAQRIGYVGQQPFLFSGTVSENIAYGCEGSSQADIEEAARMADIHPEIMNMSEGYDTQIGEHGSKLSGGQRQRVALARMFLRRPDILILDEATSALDNISEETVQSALNETMAGRTVIAVAHRLTTLRAADRIIVLEDGRIREEGRFEDLARRGGLFGRLLEASGDQPEDEECSPVVVPTGPVMAGS